MLLYRIPWFVSLSLVHCPQMAEDIDMITLAYDSRMSLPDRVTNLAYIGQPLPPEILP